MKPAVFESFCQLAYESAGIELRPGKEAMLAARIARRQRALGVSDPEAYLALLREDRTGEELSCFLDAIATNYTWFMREPEHFRVLDEALREWARAGQRRFRLWSAAAATGEEPYSMAMIAAEALAGSAPDLLVLATDISTRALARGQAGVYGAGDVARLDRAAVERWLAARPSEAGREPTFAVREQLRDLVVFRRLNLASLPLPVRGPLDVVFCRNVMFYFDEVLRRALARELDRVLRPGGLLFIGHSESLTGLGLDLVMVRPSVYRKLGAG